MSEEVRQTTPPDEEMSEYWERLPNGEAHLRGVEVYTGDALLEGYWRVAIFAQEYFRRNPLGLELRQRLQTALSTVPGVTDAVEGLPALLRASMTSPRRSARGRRAGCRRRRPLSC